jgi:hypothetical protein
MSRTTFNCKSLHMLVGASAVAIVLAAFALPSLAAGGGHGAGGGGAGGVSGTHSSDQGMANSNGPNSPDRDKGLARAEDRRSTEGTENSKAPGKHKSAAKDKDKSVAKYKEAAKDKKKWKVLD